MNSSPQEELEVQTPISLGNISAHLDDSNAQEEIKNRQKGSANENNLSMSFKFSPKQLPTEQRVFEENGTYGTEGKEKTTDSIDDPSPQQIQNQLGGKSDSIKCLQVMTRDQLSNSESRPTILNDDENSPSPDNASPDSSVRVAQNFQVIKVSSTPLVEEQQSSEGASGSNNNAAPVAGPSQNNVRAPARSSFQVQGSIIVSSMVQVAQEVAQEVIFEVGAAIDNEPQSAFQDANNQRAGTEQSDLDAMVVVDNIPWLVKTHFDYQDMMADLSTTDFWFHKLIYPIMTFGLAICSAIFTIMVDDIDVEKHGDTFLESLEMENARYQPRQAFLLVHTNIYLYYAQTVTDVLIVCALYCSCGRRSQLRRQFSKMQRCGVWLLTGVSMLLNFFNVHQILQLWFFLQDPQILKLKAHKEHRAGFLQWYKLCQILFDTRRFFWFMIAFVIVFLTFTALIIKTSLVVFYAYERRQGRIYVNSPQLRFYRNNTVKSHMLRSEIKKFLEENKQKYVVPENIDAKGEKTAGCIEECMICLQEFAENDEECQIVVLNCGIQAETALIPTPIPTSATTGTDQKNNQDTERGLVTDRAPSENIESPYKITELEQQKTRHIFHYECLKEWLKKREVCPLCNMDILPKASSSD